MRQSQYYRGRRKSTAGVSLVEVMASCTIFITASLGAFACIVYGTSTLNVENHRRSAVEVAHSRMETLRTAVFSNLPSLAETDTAVTIDEISGTRDTVVAAIDENSDDTIDYYTVTVSVAWSERGATQSVELVTLFSDPAAAGKLGLMGMHERVRLLGGGLSIRSKLGKGTTIVADVPTETSIE